MATDDRQIIITGTAPAPAQWTVPGSGQIRPKSVFATFNGTGAAAAYCRALKIISDGGQTVCIARTSETVAAGASADVSWFLGGGGTSSSTVIAGQIVQAYWGNATALDFSWNNAVENSSGFPTNNTFTKLFDNTYIQIMFEGDFIPGAAADNLGLGCFLNGGNRLNVFTGTVGGGLISSVQGATNRNLPGDPVSFPAGAYTVDMKVISLKGQATTFKCSNAATLSIVEIGPL